MKLKLLFGLTSFFLLSCSPNPQAQLNKKNILELKTQVNTLQDLIGELNLEKLSQKNTQIKNKPDLIVADITYKDRSIYVSYTNQGLTKGEGDFLIKLSVSGTENSFAGNYYYRFSIPNPNEVKKTGGISLGLIGLEKGMESIIVAEIDWENRVFESNETNNVFYKQLRLK